MISRNMVRIALALSLFCAAGGQQSLHANHVLVGEAFVSPNSGWVDAFPDRDGNWRINLHSDTPTLMDTNNANPPTSGAVTNSGVYEPDVLVKQSFLAPSSYELNARMRTNDDDIIGLVWNYQNPDNYFRVGIRQQAAGSFGGTQGLAVQKIVNGVLTQISPAVVGPGAASPITQAMIDGRTPFDLRVVVDGQDYEVFFDGASIVAGTDADLEVDRRIGVQSWAQQADAAAVTPFWGTEVETISVSDSSGTLFSEAFNLTNTQWRHLNMTNSDGLSIPINGVEAGSTTASREAIGNFGQDINDPWIFQHSNGFVYATASTPHIDFIGPAVVVDDAGSGDFSDYEFKVRLGATDNDGYGVIVRAQDDNNFYRINFANEAIGDGDPSRAPQGLSVQKVLNGAWSELYRDPQDGSAQFLPQDSPNGSTPATTDIDGNLTMLMFDLRVRAIGDTLAIRVTDHLGNVFNYDPIVDSNNPFLTGTVGLTTWGTDNVYFMGYGGGDGPLLVRIPEPASIALALLAGLGVLAFRRSRRA
ncbi:MAG: PEP-CTERM sorting domain-containing protein [Pirellulales bacterium]